MGAAPDVTCQGEKISPAYQPTALAFVRAAADALCGSKAARRWCVAFFRDLHPAQETRASLHACCSRACERTRSGLVLQSNCASHCWCDRINAPFFFFFFFPRRGWTGVESFDRSEGPHDAQEVRDYVRTQLDRKEAPSCGAGAPRRGPIRGGGSRGRGVTREKIGLGRGKSSHAHAAHTSLCTHCRQHAVMMQRRSGGVARPASRSGRGHLADRLMVEGHTGGLGEHITGASACTPIMI